MNQMRTPSGTPRSHASSFAGKRVRGLLDRLFVCLMIGVAVPLQLAAQEREGDELKVEGELDAFLGAPAMTMRPLFDGERFPNIVTARDGTVVASWGSQRVRVRRSDDGGESWGPEIRVGDGIHGGGMIVHEQTGDLLLFTHPEHPPRGQLQRPLRVVRRAVPIAGARA